MDKELNDNVRSSIGVVYIGKKTEDNLLRWLGRITNTISGRRETVYCTRRQIAFGGNSMLTRHYDLNFFILLNYSKYDYGWKKIPMAVAYLHRGNEAAA